jgi:predicted short-subunit dehydrogenase-like oxidoreductase (DUF2520 family)
MLPLRSISIVGTGNTAFQLGKVLYQAGMVIKNVSGRKHSEAMILADELNAEATHLSEIEGDIILLCVADDSISDISSSLKTESPIVHCSGSTSINALQNNSSKGVFYPLQTLSKTRDVDFRQVPILIESENNELLESLSCMAKMISDQVHVVNSEDRSKYHLSAVFVNNFINHLIHLSKNELDRSNLDFSLLRPLIDETIKKTFDMGPFYAQTGPARRGDRNVIEKQKSQLEGNTQQIYSKLSESILKIYHDQL